MKTQFLQSLLLKKERGQAIILIAFAIIGLVAMVGLVIDTGIVFIEYGRLKRSVDAAAIAAAQQYRSVSGGTALDRTGMENAAKNFMLLNSSDAVNIVIHTCSDTSDRPTLCNQDADITLHPEKNRKLVTVVASKEVQFSFLRVIGWKSISISTMATGEAATLDLVMIVDTSASMAYETSGSLLYSDPGDDPSVCNISNTCQPLREVKRLAVDFIENIYFPYDRVAVISMTSQTPGGDRNPIEVIPLTVDKATVQGAINGLKVFEPRDCDPNNVIPGSCLNYDSGTFIGATCPFYDTQAGATNDDGTANIAVASVPDPSSCNSSNVGGTLLMAANTLSNTSTTVPRPEAFWVVIALLSGPANVTDAQLPAYPYGYCPMYTWLPPPYDDNPWCRDRKPSVRHAATDTMSYTNPMSGDTSTISIYDADDYARDMADDLATLTSDGVTIYTIGLGAQVQSTTTVDTGEDPAGEALLEYIAEGSNPTGANQGRYFFAPTGSALADVFELIASNIATRISQ